MPGVLTKNSPKKIEYWKEYRRRNALRCREQRSEWREANRERIRLCARRSYYRKLLRLGQGDKQVINCLLYTSPSPRDLSTSRMPSSA